MTGVSWRVTGGHPERHDFRDADHDGGDDEQNAYLDNGGTKSRGTVGIAQMDRIQRLEATVEWRYGRANP